jgi:hypothetical protein
MPASIRFSLHAMALALIFSSGAAFAQTQEASASQDPGGAEAGLSFGGYLRSQAGTLFSDGRYFTEENTLSLNLDYSTKIGRLHANPALYERGGVVQTPVLREGYVEISTDALDFRIGKQLVIWGKADGAFITDLVSPKDLSQFLTPEFEEIRLGVTGIRTDMYLDKLRLQLVWLPWFTPAITPAPGSLWYRAPVAPIPLIMLPAILPEHNLASGEYFGKLAWSVAGLDLELVGASMWDDLPVAHVVARTGAPSPSLTVRPEYYRTLMAGGNASLPIGSAILRAEAAYIHGKRFQADPSIVMDGFLERDSLQYLVGTDFALAGINMNLQFIQDIVLDHASAIQRLPVKTTAMAGFAAAMFHETLSFDFLVYAGLETKDFLLKPKLAWKVADGVELSGGASVFLGDSGDFGRYSDNSGAFLKLKMSF